MPYIITTTRTIVGGYTVPGERESITDISRRAVATLEEARLHLRCELPGAYEWITDGDYADMMADIDALTESGGTIGPLPDGTVIEVEQVSGYELAAAAGWPTNTNRNGDPALIAAIASMPEVIDAYNAAHAVRA